MSEMVDLKDHAEAIMHKNMVNKRRTFKFLYRLRKELDKTRGRIMFMHRIPKVRASFAEVKKEKKNKREACYEWRRYDNHYKQRD